MCIFSFAGYINRPHLSAAADYFIRAFREGQLGPIFLDADLLKSGKSHWICLVVYLISVADSVIWQSYCPWVKTRNC